MKRPIFPLCLLAASIVAGTITVAKAQDITTTELLYAGGRCDHVIELVHRYGVNNSVNCLASGSMIHHSPLGAMVLNEVDLGDLEVVQVSQIVEKDPACGPKFAVLVRNASCRDVCNFHISAVGVLGRIHPLSPTATVAVKQIAAGETLQVEVTLPIESLAMGNRNGQIIGLQRLVVAIDSFDQLMESNEANNLKAFEINQIPVSSPVVEPSETAVSGTAVDVGDTPAPTAEGPSTGSPAVARQSAPPPANADPLRSAIEQMTNEPSM